MYSSQCSHNIYNHRHTVPQLQAGQEQRQQLKRDLELAKKRQQAQLTRLQRQVMEAQARRRQWTEEKERLLRSVSQLRSKLNECDQ